MLWRFVAGRVGAAVILAVGIVIVAFSLTSLLPGDAVTSQLGEQAAANPEIVARFRAQYGLDQPLYVQFFAYLGNLFQGNLGTSLESRRPVLTDLAQFGPASAELALTATIIAIVLGVGGGVLAALRADKISDQVLRVVSLGGVSVPLFWLSLIATAVLSTSLRLFPSSGRLNPGVQPPPQVTGLYTIDSLIAGNLPLFGQAVWHLVLPALVLSMPMIGLLLRFTRSSTLEVLNNEYVRAAEAKGLPRFTIVRRHVLRGALVPVITVLGTAFASLLAGTVLVEQIFAWPGIGSYAYRSATNLDLPAIVGVTLFVAMVYVVINLLVDVLYGFIDPRIRAA
ncbi:ABC transporter permease [Herbiconiux sp. L3-i23]|uniref:ABC transporter permease n=1 Tax=Herbiconiux sp. L3-i23 TaxID=2905871 RepID=UPI00204BEAF8|nr:ABC transporter permease [Herbiconiux sp. L3-i23]BDI21864.1 peptide ABC transporter permease [Herbiconiux sp. L3-i23]